MKTKLFTVSALLILILVTSACGSQPTLTPAVDAPSDGVATSTEASPGVPENLDSLIAALRAAGATVEAGDEVEQPFFTTAGQIIKVNGQDLQVFVYDSAEAMEADAAQVAADGGSIGTSMVNWMAPPHFYKLGSILALYVGEDQAVIDLLEGIFGPQFAGR